MPLGDENGPTSASGPHPSRAGAEGRSSLRPSLRPMTRREAASIPACQRRGVLQARDGRLGRGPRERSWLRVAIVAGLGLGALVGPITPAPAQQVGSTTRLPVPRFVSLKSDRVNLREGPDKKHPTTWIFQRAGLPVEITAEFDTWRKIRDSEGSEGWVLHSLLSGRRTVLVAPWKKDHSLPLRDAPGEAGPVTANLQPGVLGNVKRCDGAWCRIFGDGFDGYLEQSSLWGVYPGERVD